MKAGRELDALVAEYVMGWTWDRPKSEGGLLGPCEGDPRFNWCAEWDENGLPDWLPQYSTLVICAWEVVTKMQERGYPIDLSNSTGKWYARFLDKAHGIPFSVFESTCPEAICLGALRVLRVQVPA